MAAATKIAYFSMEIALSDTLPTYSGGLGVLAGDTVRSAADGGVPMVAVSLVHRKGYFRQRLDAAGQHAAFTLFVEAAAGGWPLVCAARMPPVDLALRDDLRTRLGGGLVYALQPLTDGELRAALEAQARARGLTLGGEVIDFLLTHHARDMKHLQSLLARLDDQAWIDKRARITLPLLRRALAAQDERGPLP